MIKSYEKIARSDGYRGIRVAVTVAGKVRQKYFRHGKMKEAIAQEKQWLKEQKELAPDMPRRHTVTYTYSAERYDPPKRTTIVGLTMAFAAQTKLKPPRDYVVINIFCRDDNGVDHATTRTVTQYRSLEDTWKESCQLLAEYRGYKRVPKGWYAACPTYDDWEKLRQWYCDHGRQISVNAMAVLEKSKKLRRNQDGDDPQ